jgi:hypothetical protein
VDQTREWECLVGPRIVRPGRPVSAYVWRFLLGVVTAYMAVSLGHVSGLLVIPGVMLAVGGWRAMRRHDAGITPARTHKAKAMPTTTRR